MKKSLIRLAASLPAGSAARHSVLRLAADAAVDPSELLSELRSFSGGGGYTKTGLPPVLITDGVEYLCEKAQSWWLVDAIASHQASRRVAAEEFQVWNLKRSKSGSGALLYADNGDGNKIASQRIPYTDFPLPAIKLYCVRNPEQRPIVMLPNEY